ncbi:glycoside hydrolase family 3 N-terminal domain-containing protein [uncultured Corynebacterium sp.]|uniref:glycoside hydrolase family 3 N-terminal domain-containing protein n=1 Tax=uncultured Corynebacterium sp. TaxID=159447 RepID=UPI002596CB9D|nr:glycoside hydrolase family 3 N-terminal domain-containing protein [uncultured Corynebacterium sp.]
MLRATSRAAATALALCLTAVLSGCAGPDPAETPEPAETAGPAEPEPRLEQPTPSPQEAPAPPELSEAERRVPADLRAKVASLMVVGVSNYDQARAALDQGAGGLVIPSWADPKLLTEEGRNINALRAEYRRPFSVAVDFEGGRVQRHTGVFGTWMPPGDLAHQPPEVIRGTGYDIGRSLRAHGVNVDYAPVLDLDVGGLPIVGDRAFGADPSEVERAATLFSQGLYDAGVTPTFKHFPGHGRASGDTHVALAVTPPLEELKRLDMLPYGPVLGAFPRASVMMGHMIVPGLGPDGVPSSLNAEAYRVLRAGDYPGGAPYDGVIVTDDLSGMRGILDYAPTPEAVKRAIAAGADQALWSAGTDVAGIIDAVTAAAASGEIPLERIDDAAVRTQQQLLNVGL